MADTKKVSFGFTKLSKQPKIKPVRTDDSTIQFIEYLDSKSIKIKGGEDKRKEREIVIPLNNAINSKDNLLVANVKRSNIRNEVSKIVDNTVGQLNNLDEIAARELIEEASKSHLKKTDDQTVFSVPVQSGSENDVESTLDDYEAVPIAKFGAAMLRGMGWDPSKGIGKSEKLVALSEPKVRPRGMGLGVVLENAKPKPQNSVLNSKPEEEELKIVKGAYVHVTKGQHKEMYGQIEGFNEETGRLIVKLALGGTSISLNEYMVNLVSKEEFTKNSRVLNASKYQEYKSNEIQQNSQSHDETPNVSNRDIKKKHERESETLLPLSSTSSSSSSRSRSRSCELKKKGRKEQRRRSQSRSPRSRSRSPRPSQRSKYMNEVRRRKSPSEYYVHKKSRY